MASKKLSFFVVSFFSILLVFCATAGAAGLTGYDIIKKTREIKAPKDQISTVTLHLINKDNQKRKIVTKRYWKNYAGAKGFDSKTVFFTTFPPDAKGTGFLIWDYKEESKSDALWLYLPTLRQTRRVSARDKDDAFMGSDLTFADMGQRSLEEDNHKLIKTEKYNDIDCYVVESTPKDKSSIYGKRIQWVSKKDLITLRLDYYDQKMDLLKKQIIEWDMVGDLWIWNNTKVHNVQTNHKTVYAITNLKNNVNVKERMFTERTLKTGGR